MLTSWAHIMQMGTLNRTEGLLEYEVRLEWQPVALIIANGS
jgi:hypothetical protein